MNYLLHLKKDQKLSAVLASQPTIALSSQFDLFTYLCRSIISQQLSTKVAGIISERFFLLFNKQENLASQIILKGVDELRTVGLSSSKASYMLNLASFYLEQQEEWELLSELSDEEIIRFLCQIKGVGKWTVQMLLMFALGREDVFPVDDLGIQQAMIRLYNIKATDKKELKMEMISISALWSPYRTYACMHLWKWKDD